MWRKFWADRDIKQGQIQYCVVSGHGDPVKEYEETVRGQTRVIAWVVYGLDKMMHGMQLGEPGLLQQTRMWAQKGYLRALVIRLLADGFRVWVTSDHGNAEAAGCGTLKEGTIVESKGERVRIYQTSQLRDIAIGKIPGAVAWPGAGLPDNFLPLLAPGRSAFTKEETVSVSHGGCLFDEVIVPMVEILRVSS